MNDDDRLGALGDRGLDLRGIDEVVGSDVDEDGKRTGLKGAERGSDERIGSADHLIARTDAERGKRDVQSSGAVGNADGVLDAEPLGPRRFELHSDRTGPIVHLAGMKDVENLLVGLRIKLRPRREALAPYGLAALNRKLLRALFGIALFRCALCALLFGRAFLSTRAFAFSRHVVFTPVFCLT